MHVFAMFIAFAESPDLLVDAAHAAVEAGAALWAVTDFAVGEALTFDPCRR